MIMMTTWSRVTSLLSSPPSKVHIPLRRENTRIGSSPWLRPRTQTLKFALPPTQNLNANQWNIGCVGSPGIGARVGHVHFIVFASISFALGSQLEHSFQ